MQLLARAASSASHGVLQAELVTQFLDDPGQHPLVRAQVAARLTEEQEITRRLVDRRLPDEVRRSLVIALGRATIQEEKTLKALQDIVVKESDEPLRHFSLLSLAQVQQIHIGQTNKAELTRFLIRQLVKPRSFPLRPSAALALALHAQTNPGERIRAGSEILGQLSLTRNPSHLAAMALGLGILREPRAREPLAELLPSIQIPRLRSYFSWALGRLGSTQETSGVQCIDRCRSTRYASAIAPAFVDSKDPELLTAVFLQRRDEWSRNLTAACNYLAVPPPLQEIFHLLRASAVLHRPAP